jgi:hypothetical protein
MVWIWGTNAERMDDTLAWFPTHVTKPFTSSNEATIAAARDLIHALNNPSLASPICPISNIQQEALHQLVGIFTQQTACTSPFNNPRPSTATQQE